MNDYYKTLVKKVAVAGVCVLTVGLVPNWEHQITQLQKLQILGKQTTTRVTDVTAAPELAALADNPVLSAKSALAYDYSSGSILFTINFDEKHPVASLTKLVTALVVAETGKWNDVVVIEASDVKVIGANTGLVPGEKILVSDLIKAMLISSHNDSTLALARHTAGSIDDFVLQMNNKAKQLGMSNTNFTNPVGFDDPKHYSTAQDLSLALKQFLSHESLAEIVKTKETEINSVDGVFKHQLKTTNKLLIEDPNVVGVKTGYTSEAKGNLVIRSDKHRANVVTIVLGSDNREDDSRKILDWVYTVYRW